MIKIETFITGFAGWWVFAEKLSARWLVCCVASLVGVVLVIRPPALFEGGAPDTATDATSEAIGRCLNVLAALAGSIISISVKLAPDAHFLEVQHVADLALGLVLGPVLLIATGSPSELASMDVAVAACVSAFFGCAALCMFTLSFQKGAAGRVAVLNYVEVPIAYAAQVFLFGEALQWTAIVGSGLIIASSLAAALEVHGSDDSAHGSECELPM